MAERPHGTLPPSHPLRWFPEFWELSRRRLRPQARLLALALAVGVAAGLGAVVFYVATQVVVHYALDVAAGYHPHHPGGEKPLLRPTARPLRPWLLPLIAAAGGIVSGVFVFTAAPEAEGHGTDACISAYHFQQGRIRARVPLVKMIASAVTIGTGGSGGREGPIAQIGAGIGSCLADLLRLNAAERRVLLAAGIAAGVAAIFRAPLAGALFAAEVLYRSPDFESKVIIPAALASITAYCTFGMVFGYSPLFAIPPEILKLLTFDSPLQLVSYLLLAVFMAVLAMLYTRTFYGVAHAFRRLPVRPHFKPAIGALLSGGLALGLYYLFGSRKQLLSVLSFGYGILQDAMTLPPAQESDLSLALVLLAVAVGKIATTGLTIGSGGSGGVFGPSMVIGGCGGGALGVLLHRFWPLLAPHPATFVVVGMAGFFAAAAKTPFSTLIIVSEMTGNYHLLLPTLWVCAIAFLLSDEQSIYSSQVESRSRSPAYQGDYVRDVLAGLQVSRFLVPTREVPSIRPADRLSEILDHFDRTAHHILPVADEQGRFLGVVSLDEVHLASQLSALHRWVVAEDLMRTDIVPLRPSDPLDLALERFVEGDCLELPVVDGSPERRLIGIARRADIAGTYLRHIHGEAPPPGPLPRID
jgi:CIC family chloride channel protein